MHRYNFIFFKMISLVKQLIIFCLILFSENLSFACTCDNVRYYGKPRYIKCENKHRVIFTRKGASTFENMRKNFLGISTLNK